jgi:hypothetical protein
MAQPRTTTPIDQDIATIVGGYFSPDHLGPTAYDEIVRRVRAAPDAYLQAFEARFLGPGADPLAVADLYLPAFLQLLVDRNPAQVRAVAGRVAALLTSGIPAGRPEDWEALDDEGEPDEPTRKRRRLQEQLATLGTVTGRRP